VHANKGDDITPWRRNEQCFLRCERLEPPMSQLGHSRGSGVDCESACPQIPDILAAPFLRRYVPCVDGSELARAFFTFAALVGAARRVQLPAFQYDIHAPYAWPRSSSTDAGSLMFRAMCELGSRSA
jgi:hypothetical protein